MTLSGLMSLAPPDPDLSRDALFLDLDGTLAEIADEPRAARVDAAMLAALRLAANAGAVAVLTGRTIEDADEILEGAIEAIAGLHGLESRLSPQVWTRRLTPHEAMAEVSAKAQEKIARNCLNVRLENKGASLALHYRHAPDEETRVRAWAEHIAERLGLRALRGKMVVEILPAGATKGDALREFMQLPLFAGRRPVVAGDDVTDESAFAAANALGGISVLVGPERETAARYRLERVADVGAWLARAKR